MENITITISYRQAMALIDACNCFSDAVEGNMDSLIEVWMPKDGPDEDAANQMGLDTAQWAQEAAGQLRNAREAARKRDPHTQELLHHLKMRRKYGPSYNPW